MALTISRPKKSKAIEWQARLSSRYGIHTTVSATGDLIANAGDEAKIESLAEALADAVPYVFDIVEKIGPLIVIRVE